ncbi:MAG: GspH/FimT family pseudopilin [Sideroxydans sp.]|nr:GspH/FimT family pseudopilin [Sideroxydans sp.]
MLNAQPNVSATATGGVCSTVVTKGLPARAAGFSLVEAMIAISIAGILMAAGIPSFQAWMKNTQVRTAAESVLNGLQLARAEAASRNAQVSFTLAANTWAVEVLADAPSNIAYKKVQSNALNSQIIATAKTLTFDGMGKVTPAANATVIIDVQNPAGGACSTANSTSGVRCMQIQVKAGGAVRMCDPALSLATNPQGCV